MISHSWFFGHIPFMLQWLREQPPDTNPFFMSLYLLNSYQRFFPGRNSPPPIIYLDLWPLSNPLMIAMEPDMSAQFTETLSLPKHPIVAEALAPLTQSQDLTSSNGNEWKTWRRRFNPGFSMRNLLALLPEILEEVIVFSQNMSKRVGEDGQWGQMFPLETAATDLTFDVIGRAVL